MESGLFDEPLGLAMLPGRGQVSMTFGIRIGLKDLLHIETGRSIYSSIAVCSSQRSMFFLSYSMPLLHPLQESGRVVT